jgi:hypothetical protein
MPIRWPGLDPHGGEWYDRGDFVESLPPELNGRGDGGKVRGGGIGDSVLRSGRVLI